MKKILLMIMLLISTTLFSQDTTLYIDEVIVTHSVKADEKDPISFENIETKSIDKLQRAQEIPGLIKGQTSVNAFSDAGNFVGYSYFSIRNIDQTRINVTYDGVPLNEPEDQGAYFSNFPGFSNHVKSIQIQRGIGTFSNGTANYGGSINFESDKLESKPSFAINSGFGSFNTYQITTKINTGKIKNWRFGFGNTYTNSDVYRRHSGFKGNSTFFNALWLKDKNSLKLVAFIGRSRSQMA